MKLLNGKIAIITGASSGIGKAAAKIFAAHGASVVLVARREASLKSAVDEIEDQGGRALAIVGDVTEAGTHDEAVAAARTTFGGLHIAFNNAGLVGTTGPLADEPGRREIRKIIGLIAEGGVVMPSFQPAQMTGGHELAEQLHAAAQAGAGGATFYNYGLLREEQLGFIGEALRTL